MKIIKLYSMKSLSIDSLLRDGDICTLENTLTDSDILWSYSKGFFKTLDNKTMMKANDSANIKSITKFSIVEDNIKISDRFVVFIEQLAKYLREFNLDNPYHFSFIFKKNQFNVDIGKIRNNKFYSGVCSFKYSPIEKVLSNLETINMNLSTITKNIGDKVIEEIDDKVEKWLQEDLNSRENYLPKNYSSVKRILKKRKKR